MNNVGGKSSLEIFRTYSWMFKEWIEHKLSKDEGYNWTKCPVCGHLTMTENYICPFCEWEYDDVVDENEESYINGSTIVEYRMRVIGKYGEKIIKKSLGNK